MSEPGRQAPEGGTSGSGGDGWSTPAGWGGSPPEQAYGGQPGSPQPGHPQPGNLQPGTPQPGGPQPGGPQPGGQGYGGQGYGEPFGQAPSGWGMRPPDVKPGVVPLRPLGLGEVLDGAVGVLRRYPRPTLGLAAVIAVVSVLVQTFVLSTLLRPLLDLDPAALESGDQEALQEAFGGAAAGSLLSAAVAVLSSAVLTGALTALVGRAVLGQPMSFAEAWASVRPVLLRLVGLALLTGAAVGATILVGTLVGGLLIRLAGVGGAVVGGLLIFASLLAAVYVYVRLALAPCALVLERTGLRASLRRSWTLVRGDWWRVFGILLLVQVIAGFVTFTLQAPFNALGADSLGTFFNGESDPFTLRSLVFSSIGGVITATLVSPFVAGARALLYVDRRMRAEGLDVALSTAAAERR